MEQRIQSFPWDSPDRNNRDLLTGLYNRAFMGQALERLKKTQSFPVTILAASVDGISRVNEARGREAGDLLIKGAAIVLRMAFREKDLLIRKGGDVFVVLLPRMSQECAGSLMVRINYCLQTYNSTSSEPAVALSIGVRTAEAEGEIPRALEIAEELMNEEKARRGARREP